MAVAFDASTAAITSVNGVATMTVSNMTVGSGSNRALVAGVMWDTNAALPTGITVTWDSGGTNQSMSLIPGTSALAINNSGSIALYGLVAPTSGNKSLVISWTGNQEAHAFAASFTGVDQTGGATSFPHGNNAVSASSASPETVTNTSATGNFVVAYFSQGLSSFGAISGTTIAIDESGPNIGVAASRTTGAASVTSTAAFSGTGPWSASATDILAAGGGGGFTPVYFEGLDSSTTAFPSRITATPKTRGAIWTSDQGTQLPPETFRPHGWPIAPPQPPARQGKVSDAGAVMAGDQGTQAGFIRFFPMGGEIPPFQPPNPPRPEGRPAAIMVGDQGIQAQFIRFFPSGWEIAPHQPRHPRREAAGAIMPSEAGIEAKYVFVPPTTLPWGWEGQSTPLRRDVNYGPAVGGSADFVSFFFQPFNWEIPSFQPPSPRPERAGAIATSEPGVEAKFV